MLETDRLILRKLTPGDAEALYRIYHEPDVLKYFTHGPPESIDSERAGIERHLVHYQRHGFGLLATVLKDSGELIGRCGLLSQRLDGAEEIEIAYLLSPRFWRRGFASEAARAVRDFASHSLGHSRLVSIIHPGNIASRRVATAIGMTFSRMARLYDIDVEVFSLTKSPDEVRLRTSELDADTLLRPVVSLRDVTEDDLPLFFKHQLDPDANQMAAFAAKNPSDRDAFLARWIGMLNNEIIVKKTVLADGLVAGHVMSFVAPWSGELEVSYWISKKLWGRGIATRALEQFLVCQTTRPLHARAAWDNIGSIRVLEKCGFKNAGHDKGFSNARGQEVEEVVMKFGTSEEIPWTIHET